MARYQFHLSGQYDNVRRKQQAIHRGKRVARFDKYMLSQLITLFGFFALVLVLVYWVNRAVILFDQLIANGHSAMVFLEFSALTVPNVIRLALPIAAFAASVYVANRLASDSELVVMQTTGYSPFRLARPVLVFGLVAALMMSALAHYLVPTSLAQLKVRQAEIASSATARLLREGTFLHPSSGLTFYAAAIDSDGTLRNIFLSDYRDRDLHTTYTAGEALLVQNDDGTNLIMLDGLAQALDRKTQTLSTTSFSEFVFNIGPLLSLSRSAPTAPWELPTWNLLQPGPDLLERITYNPARLVVTAHERFAETLITIVVALVGFAAILLGGFSRFSLWKQILLGIVLLIILKTIDNYMVAEARRSGAWPLLYLPSALGFAMTGIMLWLSDRPALRPAAWKRHPA